MYKLTGLRRSPTVRSARSIRRSERTVYEVELRKKSYKTVEGAISLIDCFCPFSANMPAAGRSVYGCEVYVCMQREERELSTQHLLQVEANCAKVFELTNLPPWR